MFIDEIHKKINLDVVSMERNGEIMIESSILT